MLINRKNILPFIDERPRVVATLLGPGAMLPQARKARQQGADILELRIDSLSQTERDAAVTGIKKIRNEVRLPIMITVRDQIEQGPARNLSKIGDAERLNLYLKNLPWADIVDVEIKSKIASAVLRQARHFNVKTVLSYHDFSAAPSSGQIKKIVHEFKKAKGDILKIAAAPRGRKAVLNFLLQGLEIPHTRRAFIAMGELGKISRLAGFCFGSCLTYGFVLRAAAPGQVPVKDLAKIYRHLNLSRNS